jgi:hypothetical protein
MYTYINPLVGVDSPNVFDVGLDHDIKDKLEDIVSDYEKRVLLTTLFTIATLTHLFGMASTKITNFSRQVSLR